MKFYLSVEPAEVMESEDMRKRIFEELSAGVATIRRFPAQPTLKLTLYPRKNRRGAMTQFGVATTENGGIAVELGYADTPAL